MSVNEANLSELEVLRWRNAELEAKIAEHEVEREEWSIRLLFTRKRILSLGGRLASSAENFDAEVETFLLEEHKKSVSEEIRQKRREKKLQRELTVQETPSVPFLRLVSQNTVSETVYGRKNVKETKLEESVVDVTSSGFSAPINVQPRMRMRRWILS
ncbi:hypothetical protein C1645_739595 [Glomus cerebriforme]|uniref:Uncharacterized protein n=1 Tax=Glomus cerebriforme TaxID=658196 RepID=A0A397SUB1_9GLOM|nr:hypothetical protein C1645_739595 [Glomus cerebriforme]